MAGERDGDCYGLAVSYWCLQNAARSELAPGGVPTMAVVKTPQGFRQKQATAEN